MKPFKNIGKFEKKMKKM